MGLVWKESPRENHHLGGATPKTTHPYRNTGHVDQTSPPPAEGPAANPWGPVPVLAAELSPQSTRPNWERSAAADSELRPTGPKDREIHG